MPRKTTKSAISKLGLSPGTPIYLGTKETSDSKIKVFDYNDEICDEQELDSIDQAAKFISNETVSWINIDGLQDIKVIQTICDHFNVHSLVQEDIVNTNHRPKLDDFDEQLFIVFKMLYLPENSKSILYEHISLVLGKNYLLSFQEAEGDVFQPVRNRIRTAKGKLRKSKADYLAYALMDTVVDNYFLALEHIEEHIEDLDDEILTSPNKNTLLKIHTLKREISSLRKAVWPLREVVSTLLKGESKLINPKTIIYLKDLYDHLMHVVEAADSARDTLSGLAELYMSGVSNKLNEIMKVLTVMASIFIPLTFIVGVYGMNFKNMPELEWEYGYFLIWGLMLFLTGGLVFFLKKKNWF